MTQMTKEEVLYHTDQVYPGWWRMPELAKFKEKHCSIRECILMNCDCEQKLSRQDFLRVKSGLAPLGFSTLFTDRNFWMEAIGKREANDREEERKSQIEADFVFYIKELNQYCGMSFIYMNRTDNLSGDTICILEFEDGHVCDGIGECKDENFSKPKGRTIALVRALEDVDPSYWNDILSFYFTNLN